MKKIEAKIVADSISPQGHRITSMLLTYPRFIHGEVMTHRMFSRNSASSRAIPFKKMVRMVKEDPFIPIAWQKDHRGMQGTEYLSEDEIVRANNAWIWNLKQVIDNAEFLSKSNVTKQLCNRLLEPFMWHTTLITATEFENFFNLRCPQYEYYDMLTGSQRFFKSKKDWLNYYNNKPLPKAKHISKIPETDLEWLQVNKSQAEIHIQALAESMWDAMNESTPKPLEAGEWHIPFGDNIDISKLDNYYRVHIKKVRETFAKLIYDRNLYKLKIATARCARLSYMTFDGEIDYEKDIKLHDQLLKDRHFSPMEHAAQCKENNLWYANFRGWQSYRNTLGSEL